MKRPVLFLFVCAFCAAPAAAQNASQQTLDALLNEVRQLRLAIERSNSIAPRMQLLMQRAQIQDAKVTRISRDLQDVRFNLAHVSSQMANGKAQLDQIEGKITQEQNPAKRAEFEEVRQHFKTEVEQVTAEDQQLRERESELTSQLRLEQGALDMLEAKLDALEKALEPPPQQ